MLLVLIPVLCDIMGYSASSFLIFFLKPFSPISLIFSAFDEFQRELIVENTSVGLAAAQKRGRKGGRPRSMTKDKICNAESMIKDSENYPFISDMIKHLEIGRTTFYRHFPPRRISELRQLK